MDNLIIRKVDKFMQHIGIIKSMESFNPNNKKNSGNNEIPPDYKENEPVNDNVHGKAHCHVYLGLIDGDTKSVWKILWIEDVLNDPPHNKDDEEFHI
jgi:hypothetical protein